jgi:hypothetical protein
MNEPRRLALTALSVLLLKPNSIGSGVVRSTQSNYWKWLSGLFDHSGRPQGCRELNAIRKHNCFLCSPLYVKGVSVSYVRLS